MPHLICKACGLASYSAAVYGPADACPRCGRPLTGVKQKQDGARRWNSAYLIAASRSDPAHYIERSML